MTITTTITWGRSLTAQEEALVQSQLDTMAGTGLTDWTPDPGVDPEVRGWSDIGAAMAWQSWTQAGLITPGPVATQIQFP